MAVKIRMARMGAKKQPVYRIVAADSRACRDGKFLERLGTYNPKLAKNDPNRVTLKQDRILHWLSQGAQPSPRVVQFLNAANIGTEKTQVKKLNEKRTKLVALRKIQLEEKKRKEAEEAAKKAAEEAAAAAPAAEAPAEAAPAA